MHYRDSYNTTKEYEAHSGESIGCSHARPVYISKRDLAYALAGVAVGGFVLALIAWWIFEPVIDKLQAIF
jgi:hypothetical protein